jgi:hypothetical protein
MRTRTLSTRRRLTNQVSPLLRSPRESFLLLDTCTPVELERKKDVRRDARHFHGPTQLSARQSNSHLEQIRRREVLFPPPALCRSPFHLLFPLETIVIISSCSSSGKLSEPSVDGVRTRGRRRDVGEGLVGRVRSARRVREGAGLDESGRVGRS